MSTTLNERFSKQETSQPNRVTRKMPTHYVKKPYYIKTPYYKKFDAKQHVTDEMKEISSIREEIGFLNKMFMNFLADETQNVKKLISMETKNQDLESRIKKIEGNTSAKVTDDSPTKIDSDDNKSNLKKKQAVTKRETIKSPAKKPFSRPTFAEFINNDKLTDFINNGKPGKNIYNTAHKTSTDNCCGEQENVFTFVAPFDMSKGNSVGSNPVAKILEALFKQKDMSKKEENEDEIVEDDIVIDPDCKVEDIGTEIKTLDDLINLGKLFDAIKTDNTESKDMPEVDKKHKATEILTEIGVKPDDITNIISDKEIKMKHVTKKHNGLYEYGGKLYAINLEILNKMVNPLTKLKNMVGLNKIKDSILDMILYYLQNFEKKNSAMLHTAIEGPPGTGKTEIGRIIGEIYAAMGIIKSVKFKIVRRTDLIGEFVGHTAHKTQRAIDEADGGVLFIDEAYSLGSKEGRDTFSKECIDTLNQNLSENKKKFICIIAGYTNELESRFFGQNPGLSRRFPFRYVIDGYNENEMKDIFMKKINETKWSLDDSIIDSKMINLFEKNKHIIDETIKNNGNVKDVINLLLKDNTSLMTILKDNNTLIQKYSGNKDKYINELIKNNPEINKYISEHKLEIKDIANFDNIIKHCDEYNKELISFFTENKQIWEYKGIIDDFVKNNSNIFKEHSIVKFFKKNLKEFNNFGGDIDTLFLKTKFIHSRRMFGKHPKNRKILNMDDIEKGFDVFLNYKKQQEDKRNKDELAKKELKRKERFETRKEDNEIRDQLAEEEMKKHKIPDGIYV